jgi:teichuronic acid biosynthesis glycosyltransferase TuaC
MGKVKVLVISHMHPKINNPVNGIFVYEQNEALLKEGVVLRVVSPIPYVPAILQNNPKRKGYRKFPPFTMVQNVPVYYPHYLCIPGAFFYWISSYGFYLGILNLVKCLIDTFKPDVLHAHFAIPDGFAGLLLSKRLNLPIMCTLHGDDINIIPYYNRFLTHTTKKVIKETDQIVAVSKGIKKEAEKLALPKRKIKVVHNGIYVHDFVFNSRARDKVRKKLQINSKSKVLLFVGGLEINKGVYELIESFISLTSQYHNLHLIMVGIGSERHSLEKIRRGNKLSDKLHLMGQISHDAIPDFYSSSDIFVLPTYNEGFPTVIKEAMAAGLPVIASRVGGIPEVVEEGKTGYLINSKDVTSLTKAIIRCIEDENLCHKMGKYAREIVEQKFSWETNAKEHVKLYEDLLSKR